MSRFGRKTVASFISLLVVIFFYDIWDLRPASGSLSTFLRMEIVSGMYRKEIAFGTTGFSVMASGEEHPSWFPYAKYSEGLEYLTTWDFQLSTPLVAFLHITTHLFMLCLYIHYAFIALYFTTILSANLSMFTTIPKRLRIPYTEVMILLTTIFAAITIVADLLFYIFAHPSEKFRFASEEYSGGLEQTLRIEVMDLTWWMTYLTVLLLGTLWFGFGKDWLWESRLGGASESMPLPVDDEERALGVVVLKRLRGRQIVEEWQEKLDSVNMDDVISKS